MVGKIEGAKAQTNKYSGLKCFKR